MERRNETTTSKRMAAPNITHPIGGRYGEPVVARDFVVPQSGGAAVAGTAKHEARAATATSTFVLILGLMGDGSDVIRFWSSRMRKTVVLAMLAGSLSMAGAALADHELGPAPQVTAEESVGKIKVTLYPQCSVGHMNYRTEDETARAGQDYEHVEGTLAAPPYEFEIPILEDRLVEETEAVHIWISNGVSHSGPGGGGSCVGTNQSKMGRLYIYDNDGPPPSPIGVTYAGRQTSESGASSAPVTRSNTVPAADQPPPAGGSEPPVTVPLLVEETGGPPPTQDKDASQPGPSWLASIITLVLLIAFGILGFRRYRMSTPDTVVSEIDQGEAQ